MKVRKGQTWVKMIDVRTWIKSGVLYTLFFGKWFNVNMNSAFWFAVLGSVFHVQSPINARGAIITSIFLLSCFVHEFYFIQQTGSGATVLLWFGYFMVWCGYSVPMMCLFFQYNILPLFLYLFSIWLQCIVIFYHRFGVGSLILSHQIQIFFADWQTLPTLTSGH